jgi:hypothetical protein
MAATPALPVRRPRLPRPPALVQDDRWTVERIGTNLYGGALCGSEARPVQLVADSLYNPRLYMYVCVYVCVCVCVCGRQHCRCYE